MKNICRRCITASAIIILTFILCTGAFALSDSPYDDPQFTLELPASLRIIDEEAFSGDRYLERVIVPEGVKEIRSGAFAFTNVWEIYLPASLNFIADDAFLGCTETQVYAPLRSYGKSGSAAQTYAKENDLKFVVR